MLGLLAVLAWSGLGVLTAPGAAACSCAGLDDRQAFDRADVVFTARLVDRELDLLTAPSHEAVLTFQVDGVLKGNASTRQRVRTHAQGAACGWELRGSGPYLVFAFDGGSDGIVEVPHGQLRTNLCDGNRPLAPAERAGTGIRLGRGSEPGLVGPSSTPALSAALATLVLAAASGWVLWRRRRRG